MGRAQRFLCAASVVFTLVLSVGSAPAQDEEAPKPAPVALGKDTPLRVIRVRVACDEEFRRRRNWEREALTRVQTASRIFEDFFRVRWWVAEISPWESADTSESLLELMDGLEEVGSGTPVDVVLGLTAQKMPWHRFLEKEGLANGMAQYLGRTAIVRTNAWHASQRLRAHESLVHEFGHVLGAWHSDDSRSFMCPDRDFEPRTRFDAQSAAVIRITRTLDFSRGVESLTAEQFDAIDEQWRKGRHDSASHPVVDALLHRGYRYYLAGKQERALAVYRHAAELLEDDPSRADELASTRRWISYTETQLEKANAPSGSDDPSAGRPTDPDMARAAELERKGDLAGAEEWIRKALEKRRRSHGVPSLKVAGCLQRLGEILMDRNERSAADTALQQAIAMYQQCSSGAIVTRDRLCRLRGVERRTRQSTFSDEVLFVRARVDEGRIFERPGPQDVHFRVRRHPLRDPDAPPDRPTWTIRFDVAVPGPGTLSTRIVHRMPFEYGDDPGTPPKERFVEEPVGAEHRVRATSPSVLTVLVTAHAEPADGADPGGFVASCHISPVGSRPARDAAGVPVPLPANSEVCMAYGVRPDPGAFVVGRTGMHETLWVWKWGATGEDGSPRLDVPMHTWFFTVGFRPDK